MVKWIQKRTWSHLSRAFGLFVRIKGSTSKTFFHGECSQKNEAPFSYDEWLMMTERRLQTLGRMPVTMMSFIHLQSDTQGSSPLSRWKEILDKELADMPVEQQLVSQINTQFSLQIESTHQHVFFIWRQSFEARVSELMDRDERWRQDPPTVFRDMWVPQGMINLWFCHQGPRDVEMQPASLRL